MNNRSFDSENFIIANFHFYWQSIIFELKKKKWFDLENFTNVSHFYWQFVIVELKKKKLNSFEK